MKKAEKKKKSAPDWGKLYEIASTQEGFFTTAQAAGAGYYPQLLAKYLKNERIIRIRRAIYRLVHFPTGENEELIVLWLWTERTCVFSHETALMIHGLSDAMPRKTHITCPVSWKRRRLRVPAGVVMHFADVKRDDQTWFGAVSVTTVARTLEDCAGDNVSPAFVRDAFEEAAGRGLIDRGALPSVVAYLKKFFEVSRSRMGPKFRSGRRRNARELE